MAGTVPGRRPGEARRAQDDRDSTQNNGSRPARPDAPTTDSFSLVIGDADARVSLIRWPEEESVRCGLAALGCPRVLLIDEGVRPPDLLDPLEDWVRWPPNPADLLSRARHLGIRTTLTQEDEPTLDDDGLLRSGNRWVAITDGQLPILRLLLDQIDRVVRFEAIVDAYVAVGGSPNRAAVRTVLARLGARLRPLGLELISVRRRGVVLQRALH